MGAAEEQRTGTGLTVTVAPAGEDDFDELHRLLAEVVAAGEGYPQDPAVPLSWDDFAGYWLVPSATVVAARVGGELAGSYRIMPNGVGRAAHVGNAGYLVAAPWRGQGVGELLVRHSMAEALRLGFDALQFNFVFESNPARRLYERLGFTSVGRVPEVIDGEAVHIYWRRLGDEAGEQAQ
jgi:GNAT superfamily N-acetyltransferase